MGGYGGKSSIREDKGMPEQDLIKIKKAIDEAKTNEAKKEGQFSQLLKQLQEDFNCKTIAEGEEYLSEINKKIEEKEKFLKVGVQKLKEELGW
jgi:hypothetical protein